MATTQPSDVVFQVSRDARGASDDDLYDVHGIRSSDVINAAAATTGGASVGLKSTSATAGIGYATGAGGTVTQETDRSTTVEINKVCGTITTDDASLGAGLEATFQVTNSTVAATDTVVCCVKSGGTTPGSTVAHVTAVADGSFKITLTNLHASTADTAALVINFAVIKAVAA